MTYKQISQIEMTTNVCHHSVHALTLKFAVGIMFLQIKSECIVKIEMHMTSAYPILLLT